MGTLSEPEEARLEAEYFASDVRFEELEVAEDDLIDDYVRGELSLEERQKFRAKLLTSPRVDERVKFAQALVQKTSAPLWQHPQADIQTESSARARVPKSKTKWREKLFVSQPAFRPALAACVILLLFGGVVLVAGWLRLRSESNRLAAERAAIQRQQEELSKQLNEQRIKAEQLAAELQQLKNQRADDLKLIEKSQPADKSKEDQSQSRIPSTVATVFLMPGTLRSEGSKPELTIQPGTTTVRLEVTLETNDYPAYNARITNATEEIVIPRKRLRPRHQKLFLSLPARQLPADDYILRLDGVTASGKIEPFDDYEFRVKTTQ